MTNEERTFTCFYCGGTIRLREWHHCVTAGYRARLQSAKFYDYDLAPEEIARAALAEAAAGDGQPGKADVET
jgi:hypothetical protein